MISDKVREKISKKHPNLTLSDEATSIRMKKVKFVCDIHGEFEGFYHNIIDTGCVKCNIDRNTLETIRVAKSFGWGTRFEIEPIKDYPKNCRLLDLKLTCKNCGEHTTIKSKIVTAYTRRGTIPLCKNCVSKKKELRDKKREERASKYSFSKAKSSLKKDEKEAIIQDILTPLKKEEKQVEHKKPITLDISPRRKYVKSFTPSVDCADIRGKEKDISEEITSKSKPIGDLEYLEIVAKSIDDELHSFYEYMMSQKLPNEVFCEMNNRLHKMRLGVSRIRKYYGLKSY